MQIECLRSHISSGSKVFPIYIGFASAAEITNIAVAPAFTKQTDHQQIAANITAEPVRDWQRPINYDRVDQIAQVFNNSGGLMPNPVLLAKNAFTSGITIAPKRIDSTSYDTGTFIVDVPEDVDDPAQKPLWILDGQHRIAGLSKSAQSGDPVPVVLLLDDGSNSYSSPLLANLFAQVTTAATKLDELHNEWLTYAFDLGKYSAVRNPSGAAKQAFKAVVELCRTPTFRGVSNPFFNNVQFNEHRPANPTYGGFSFKCNALGDLISRHYYNLPVQHHSHLNPSELAAELSHAYIALHQTVGNHASSVFFGKPPSQQTIMQEAFIVGVLARALFYGPTADYRSLLQALKFQNTNWDFSWVRTLSGPANTISKKIARNVLEDALVQATLPEASGNLADHLKGNGAAVVLAFSKVTPAGRPAKQGKEQYKMLRGATGSHNAGTTTHVKVTEQTSNVGDFEILDAKTVGRPLRYKEMEGKGLILSDKYSKPLEIVVVMKHYGDLSSQSELQINW
ncbi:hypothetical protein E0500_008430 [Streptomyces sp. KM273126]|uniref:hypothetical protein n=1 Tax=Streptomyces sp. KM273126 TaxID=2545247 RepID=UPI001040BC56|nr:hypothetical protein [Streptomyces sp. KM273126]MBA2807440.1 hypothetical protein [Streptomyces sp. KM273126]